MGDINNNEKVAYKSADDINTKDFEKQAQLHYEKNHGTEVQKKIKALMDETADDAPTIVIPKVEKAQQPAKEQQSAPAQERSSFINDSIDEKLKKCFEETGQKQKKNKGKKQNSESEIAENDGNQVKVAEKMTETVQEEYTSPSQNVEIMGGMKNALSAVIKQLGIVFPITVLSLIFDIMAMSGKTPFFMLPGKYTAVFSLISLQFLCFCIMASIDDLKTGAKCLFDGKSTPEGSAFLTVCATFIHALLTSIFMAGNSSALTFCSIGCLSVLLMKIYKFLKLRSSIMSFQVVSLKDTKYIANKCTKDCAEATAFEEYLTEDSEILQIDGCGFIDGFFKNLNARSKNDRCIPLMSAIAFAISALIFAIVAIFAKNVYLAFSCFIGAFCALVPISSFICNALPMFFASARVFKHRSAIIGETACENFNCAAVMSFDDTLVFPPKGVKVNKIKAFGNYKIDEAVIIMAKIFKSAGGPLSVAFDNMISSATAEGEATLVNISADGLTVEYDGKEYITGIKSFISFYGLDTPADEFDTSFVSNAGSVLYLATKEELVAKFYIKYNINSQFEGLLGALYKEGICAGIRSIDPCINNDLIIAKVPTTKCPVSVIKQKQAQTKATEQRKETAILSASTATGFLHTFVVASKLKQLLSANYAIKIIGFAVTAICLLILAVTGNAQKISLNTALILQSVWMLPTVALSAFYRWK